MQGGGKIIKDFCKTIKNIKNGQFFVVDILQLPRCVISNSENLTHPSVGVFRRGGRAGGRAS